MCVANLHHVFVLNLRDWRYYNGKTVAHIGTSYGLFVQTPEEHFNKLVRRSHFHQLNLLRVQIFRNVRSLGSAFDHVPEDLAMPCEEIANDRQGSYTARQDRNDVD